MSLICRIFIQMKEESKRESREKVRQKKKRNRKNTLQKSPDAFIQTLGQFTIHLAQIIGEGTYGKVYRAAKLNTDEKFACKFIKQERIDDLQIYYKDKKVAKQLQNRLILEGQFQLSLSKCPYIAKMYKTQKNEKGFYFIMEYCQTDLAKLIKREGFLTEERALKFFKQIIQGIKYIYEKNAFHRDLKPQNLLLKNGTIKISDFGFVKIFNQIDKQCKSRRNRFETQSKVGTFRYMSPDILQLLSAQTKNINNLKEASQSEGDQTSQKQKQNDLQKKYDPQKSDVWSLGIIFYKMLYGKQPYDGKSFDEMIKKIRQNKLDFPGSIQFPPGKIIKTNVSKPVIKLIKKMLTAQQSERISFMKLYTKFNELLKQRQKQKPKDDTQNKQETAKQRSKVQIVRNKKQRLLLVYNKIMVRIYRDLSNFATLREIGIDNYSEFSYKIMTLLHQKRTGYLQSDQKLQMVEKDSKQNQTNYVDQGIKEEISQYHNVFYEQIKNLSNLQESQTLQNLLILVFFKLDKYEDFEMLIKQVQLFLLFLMQLLGLQLNIIKEDYICATQDKAQSLKIKSIENFMGDIMKLLSKKLKPQVKSKSQSKQKQFKKSHSKNKKSKQKSRLNKSTKKQRQTNEKSKPKIKRQDFQND